MTKITNPKILTFLRSVSVMSLAATQDSKPLSSVVLFAVDDDFNFYFATKSETYKAKVIDKNPKVSFSIWEHKKLLVQVDGNAKKIMDEAEIDSALDLLATATESIKDFWPPVIRSKENGEYAVYKIKSTWLRALDLNQTSIRESESPFTEIEL